MLSLLAKYRLPYVVMHMKGIPASMQKTLNTVMSLKKSLIFLIKIKQVKNKGIKNIIVDPGFGFGKNESHNFELLRNLSDLKIFNYPILVGFQESQ